MGRQESASGASKRLSIATAGGGIIQPDQSADAALAAVDAPVDGCSEDRFERNVM